MHSTDLLRLSPHLPEVIEFFDDPEIVASAIEALNHLIPAGRMISWQVECNAGWQAAEKIRFPHSPSPKMRDLRLERAAAADAFR